MLKLRDARKLKDARPPLLPNPPPSHRKGPETMAITIALFSIVFFSIVFGATLPLLLKRIGTDPAHSSTSIQVIMDILGVVFTVGISTVLLDSPWGQWIVERLVG